MTTADWCCKYQSDEITGKNTYVERITIDKAVSDVIAPIFSHKDLGSEALLSKCLHGETQSVNESLNNLIWTRCPKRIYVGNSVLKTAVASAVICYNDGVQGALPVLTKLGIEHGFFTADACRKANICRVKQANRKSPSKVKQRRKTLRAVRKGFNGKNEQEEGETYGSGAFWTSFTVVFNILHSLDPLHKGGGRSFQNWKLWLFVIRNIKQLER